MGPAEHPERPKRTQVVVESLSQLQNVRVEKLSLTPPAREKAERALRSVHAEWYLDEIKAPRTRRSLLDGADTFITVDSWDVVLAATHAWIEAVEHAAAGEVAFAVARPPGHHATKAGAMGFCLANFAAAAARYAADTLGLSRVAILDWDVHYGNGIYNIVRDDPRIHYCSIHQGGIFPGTGDANECGPLRNIKPLPVYEVGMTWKGGYERIFKDEAMSWLKEWDPEVLIVSAGYDALASDLLADMSLEPSDYRQMAEEIKTVFGCRVCFGLEGGYDCHTSAMPAAARATLEAFI